MVRSVFFGSLPSLINSKIEIGMGGDFLEFLVISSICQQLEIVDFISM